MAMIFAILLWLAIVNLAAFLAFGEDKRRAIDQACRISEASLLRLALIGGTIGAYAGRHHYRHKTRKAEFGAKLHLIAVLQIGLAGAVAGIAFPY